MRVAIIPAFNEEKRIGAVVKSVLEHVDCAIVVDDGSTDATSVCARQMGALVFRHGENCGAGAATMTGIEAARHMGATVVITIDADGQHDASTIPQIVAPIEANLADIVFTNRFGQKNAIPLIRRIFNAAGNIVSYCATGLWIHDSQCGYKAFGPRALREVEIRMSGFEFCTEIIRETALRKWRYQEIPTKVLYSAYTLAKGQSFGNGVRTALKILLRSFLR